MSMRIVRHPAAERAIEEAAAHGLLALGFAVEHDWKADVVVRGGHRSFMTGPKTKAGTPQIGGTLRRSIHTVGYLDGRQIGGPPVDANGEQVPTYDPGPGARVFVGTNSGYGAYVELGTYKMPARPAGVPAVLGLRGQAPAIIAAGARRKLGR